MTEELYSMPIDVVSTAYERLAAAVVAQAAKDHCKSFFFDQNNIFLKKLDGPALWEQIEKNFEEYGQWCQPNDYYNSFGRIEASGTESATKSRRSRERKRRREREKESENDDI